MNILDKFEADFKYKSIDGEWSKIPKGLKQVVAIDNERDSFGQRLVDVKIENVKMGQYSTTEGIWLALFSKYSEKWIIE